MQLSAWLSQDEGRTWTGGLVLDERKGISYPDGFQSPEGSIYISYDCNRSNDGEILMARFREEDALVNCGYRITANRFGIAICVGESSRTRNN